MKTAYITHPSFFRHAMGEGHPECPERWSVIGDRLLQRGLLDLMQAHDAPAATDEQLRRAHDALHIATLRARAPREGLVAIDPDTAMNPDTLQAALHAAGAAVLATDLVMRGEVSRVFCNVRPPGHHAERRAAMGFCFFNNIAVGIRHALEAHGLHRVALVDFDVHHGNGSEDILAGDDRVLMVSTFQSKLYPYSGELPRAANMHNIALNPYSDGVALREAVLAQWLPGLRDFAPQMIFVSAGFDAHREDEMSHLGWSDADYQWLSRQLVGCADEICEGRMVSMLEGGYHLPALARCVEAHVRELIGLGY